MLRIDRDAGVASTGSRFRVYTPTFSHSPPPLLNSPAVISVVVPIFNEEENLPELRARMTGALESTGDPWELVLVNDGSRDRSLEIIRQYHADDPRIKLV